MPREYATTKFVNSKRWKILNERFLTNVPSLRNEYPYEKNHQQRCCSDPSVSHMGSYLIQICLVLLITNNVSNGGRKAI